MGTRYVHNYPAFGEQVLRAQFMQSDMRSRATRIKTEFEATAPERTGHYKSSARVESGVRGGPHGDRAYGQVIVDDEAAMSIEFGHTAQDGSHVEGSYTLTKAMDAAGD